MRKRLLRYFAAIYKILLASRYRVRVEGLDKINKEGPVLILPNHQALVDPQIVFAYTAKRRVSSVLVDQDFYYSFLLNPLFRALGAIPVPDLEKVSLDELDLDYIKSAILDKLNNGSSVIIYPEGRITADGYANMAGRKLGYIISGQAPGNTQILLVRIRGLWGSIWSRAYEGRTPNFTVVLFKSIFYILANFLFFLPKREIVIEIEDASEKLRALAKQAGIIEFNEYLEQFYNTSPESFKFVPYFFFGGKMREPNSMVKESKKYYKNTAEYKEDEIPAEVFNFVVKTIKQTRKDLAERDIKLKDNLILDLRFDSLDIAEVYMLTKTQYKQPADIGLERIKTVADYCLIAMGKFEAREPLPECNFKDYDNEFSDSPVRIKPIFDIARYAIKTMNKSPKLPFVYDRIVGSVSRGEYLLKAFVLAEFIKLKTKKRTVGIMLPASGSASLLILASLIARKVPVMINWTSSASAQDHAVDISKIDTVITASTLLSKVSDQLADNLKSKLVFLDKEISNISALTKIKALLKKNLTKIYTPHFTRSPDDLATILFTSGTEGTPKTVPLSHKNIISDLKGAYDIYDFKHNEKTVAFLPPFHSFGFTVLTMFPILSGVRVAYSPDPTDALAIASVIEKTGASITGSAPTFLKKLLKEDRDRIKTLRTVISGAEKCPDDLIRSAKNLGIEIHEGYGVTECSPVISINPIDAVKPGSIGKTIPGLEVKIVNPDTHKELESGKQGLIVASGDPVFDGYLDEENRQDTFIWIDGKSFYNTGDIGYLDEEGYLFITGRLKRFVKIAGEMISLSELEKTLSDGLAPGKGEFLAVQGKECKEGVRLVVFTNMHISLQELNQALVHIPTLVRISEVRQTKELPTLASGKVDYKELKVDCHDAL